MSEWKNIDQSIQRLKRICYELQEFGGGLVMGARIKDLSTKLRLTLNQLPMTSYP